MVIFRFVFVIIVLGWLIGCTSQFSYPISMLQAENCMDTCPDSALVILEGMEDSIQTFPEEVRMYYNLLTIQAKDKLYIVHKSDTLINSIVDFYESYNDASKLMLAYYYQGRVYRDMNDAPRALKAFQRAMEVDCSDMNLKAKIFSQMGYLFSYQGLYDDAITVNRSSIEIYIRQGEKENAAYALRDIARMYDMKGMQDSTLYYYKEACQMALEADDSVRYYGILSELGCFYYDIGEKQKSEAILKSVANKPQVKRKSHIYSYIGNLYEDVQKWDSAIWYREKAIMEGNVNKKYDNYVSLADIERKKGNYLQSLHYFDLVSELNDSIQRSVQTEAIAKINSLYNYQHIEAENNRLLLREAHYKNIILLAFIVVLLVVLAWVLLCVHQKKERWKFRENERKLKELQTKSLQRSQDMIDKNKEMINQLEERLKIEKNKKKELEEQITSLQLERLKLCNQEIRLSLDQQDLAVRVLKNSNVYKLFNRVSLGENIEISVNDWTCLRAEINKAFPHFLSNIQALYPKMSMVETRICLLTKIGMGPSHIARIFGYSRSSITSARDRLYKKIFNVEGTSKNFIDFIENS